MGARPRLHGLADARRHSRARLRSRPRARARRAGLRDQPPPLARHSARRRSVAQGRRFRRQGRGGECPRHRPLHRVARDDSRPARRLRPGRRTADARGCTQRPRRRPVRRGNAHVERPAGSRATRSRHGRRAGGRAGDPDRRLRNAVLEAGRFCAVLARLRGARSLRRPAERGKGYKEATAEIERRINVLFDWLAEVHAQGRPRGLVPPL